MTDKESVVDNLGEEERGIERAMGDRCDGQVRELKMNRQRRGGETAVEREIGEVMWGR